MIKRFFAGCASALIIGTSVAAMSASATTVDDVAAVARQYGYSEELIMQGYNKYYENPSLYTSEDFDMAIAYLRSAGSSLIQTGPQVPASTTTTTTTVVTTTTSASENAGGAAAVVTTTAVQPTETKPSDVVTITMSDGTSFTRISRKEFIALSYTEKMNYIRTFTPVQQQAIIDDLSPEEYRSLLKQAPTDTKVDVVGNLSQALGQIGVNVSINEITDDKLTLDMRDENGNLIGVANAGMIVEDTGYDRSIIYKVSAALVASALAVLTVILCRTNKKKRIGEANDR